RDRWGVPIHDAKLKVDLLLNESVSYDWIETFCTPNEGVWAEDWQQEADELRQELRSATMRCTVNSTFVPDVEYDREFWESNSFMSAGNSGVVDYHDLPCIGVGAVAWHPLYGTATATLQLESGRNSLDVFFTEPATSELRVRVNSQPASSDPGEFFELSLVRSSPFGVNMFIEDSSVWLSRYWEFAPDAAVWEAVFTGVPPGWWYVSLTGASDAEAGANVELASGESKTVQLHVGENAQAQWTPVVRSGGVQLKEASFFLLGGVDCMRSQMTVVHDAESGETEPLFLSPGTWTVWMPTLPAFTFTLKPGEKRQDVFELRTITVSFVLELDLAMYLGDPKEGAFLDLLPDGEWEDVYEHLHALDQRMRQSDENYDQLMPGVASVWTIPCGEYQWNLSGNQRDLSGRMRFTPDGPTRVVFGTDSLPGYETLVVDLVGFDTDDPPDVWIDEDSVYDAAVAPQTRYYYSGPVTIFPGIFEQQLFDDVRVESIQISHDRRIFFARAGSMFLEVSGDGVSGRRAVTFPGSITLRPNQFGMTSVRFVTPETEAAAIVEDIGYEIEALTESGGFERVEDWDWAAPPGKVTIRVMRRSYYADEKALSDFIQFEIELKTKPVVIELSKLNFQPLATLDLVFRGRGSPEQTTDAWWFPEDGPTAPRLYALDAMTNGPRIVAINRISEYMPQGRLEFTCRGLDLPPGNYRVVPWPDASPKYCREFTLKAGGYTEIIVQGG
ncbi:MAG: hypothetical protein KDB32_12115, partial [Planctomycetes bacterium]|nr:hypothetical protein [Planctomycetota bacterium]